MNSFSNKIEKRLQSGSVSADDSEVKSIFILDRVKMNLIASTIADTGTGNWKCNVPYREDESLISMCRDEGGSFNIDVYDKTSLCSETYTSSSYHNSLII